jgi:hypothetical protein
LSDFRIMTPQMSDKLVSTEERKLEAEFSTWNGIGVARRRLSKEKLLPKLARLGDV